VTATAHVPRRELLAYLGGAGIAGTLIVVPYVGRAIITTIAPQFGPLTYVPFFLLPIVWGVWNWVHVRRRLRIDIGAWGAILGLAIALLVNLLLFVEDRWFGGALLLPLTVPAGYYVLWTFLVGSLNEALGIDA